MSDRLLLAGWLAAVIGTTFVHDPVVLSIALLAVLVVQPGSAGSVLLRAVVAVAFVNVTVCIAWAVSSWLAEEPWLELVLRLNLRVLLIAVLTFSMVQRVDLVRASSFSPRLRFLVVLSLGQIRVLTSLLAEYRDAFASRSPTRPRYGLRFASAGRQAAAILEKAEGQAEELNQGMRARGFFDDRG